MRLTPRVAGFRSEYPAGFKLECMAGFVGTRTQISTRRPMPMPSSTSTHNLRTWRCRPSTAAVTASRIASSSSFLRKSICAWMSRLLRIRLRNATTKGSSADTSTGNRVVGRIALCTACPSAAISMVTASLWSVIPVTGMGSQAASHVNTRSGSVNPASSLSRATARRRSQSRGGAVHSTRSASQP